MRKSIKINNLDAQFYLPDNKPKEVIIGVHGFSGDKKSSVLLALSKELIAQERALLAFDLPCHGNNDNSKPLSLNLCIKSIGEVLSYVKSRYPNTPISIFATSFGGFLTLAYLSTHNENINKLILRAPAVYMSRVLEDNILPFHGLSAKEIQAPVNLGYERQLLVDKNFLIELKTLNLEKLNPIKNYIYILQGKKDDIVDPKDTERFFESRYPHQHKIFYFENADHRFKNPGELEKIIEITLDILTN